MRLTTLCVSTCVCPPVPSFEPRPQGPGQSGFDTILQCLPIDNIVQVGIHNSDIIMDILVTGWNFEWQHLTNSTLFLLKLRLSEHYQITVVCSQAFFLFFM